MFPNADVIATAIYAAARALCPPIKVGEVALAIAQGAHDVGERVGYAGGFPLSRARCYAAVALWDAFPEASRERIARCLGSSRASAKPWAGSLDRNLRMGMVKWWDDDVECAVRAAVDWVMQREPGPIDLPGFIPAKENPAPMV